MPGIVSDSSPLIHLSQIGRLSLLRDLYQQVVIPSAVWREVVEEGWGRAGTHEVREAADLGWITVRSVENSQFVRLLQRTLDDGESEAIALVVEQSASLILLDETDARRTAATLGVQVTGVIGILIKARERG